ncbi:MAG: hypothetical protein HY059_09250 [Proteobacteria bacterium]|nr:hypothetical protein [Pseudomonadota bacterium]
MTRAGLLLLPLLLTSAAVRSAEPDYASYVAGPEDLLALQDGMADARRMAGELFPKGIDAVDVVLYDSREVILYTRTPRELAGGGTFGEYRVYRVPHEAKLTMRDMHGCRGLGSEFIKKALGAAYPAGRAFECAPFGTVAPYHAARERLYDTRESYLATVLHEYGHQYLNQQRGRIPLAEKIWELTAPLGEHRKRYEVWHEAFAIWCELRAARTLYPAFFEKLKARDTSAHASPHDRGQELALELLDWP